MLTFTAQGRIEVYLNGVLISRHVQEREAIESISRHQGIGTYEVIYPKVLVRKVERVSRETFVETGYGYGYGSGMAVEVVRRIVDVTAPTVGAMTASGMTATQVNLAWPSVSDVDFSYFELQKSTNGVNFGFLTTKITTSHTDTGLTAGSAYSYRYRIIDQSGNRSAFSSVISPIFPSVPSGLTVTSVSGTTITLDWSDNVHPVSGYRVYRSTDGTNFTLIASPTTSTHPDTGLTAGVTYYYRVSAVTAYGESSYATVSQQTSVSGPDWIQSLPTSLPPFTRGVSGQTFDFYPTYLSTNNAISITVETGTLPSEIRIVNSPTPRLAYDGTGTGSISAQVSFRVATSALSDWQSRISGSNVVWYHNFDADAEVSQFRFSSGSQIASDCARHAGGGVHGGDALRLTHRVGNVSAPGWARVMAPLTGATNGKGVDDPGASGAITRRAWSTSYVGNSPEVSGFRYGMYGHPTYNTDATYPFDGHDYYVQLRFKVSSGRFNVNQFPEYGNHGGKSIYFDKMGGSNQEIVVMNPYSYGPAWAWMAQTRFGVGLEAPGNVLEPGGQWPSCGTGPNHLSPWCFNLQPNQWYTFLYHITLGVAAAGGESTLGMQVYVVLPGETSYRTLVDYAQFPQYYSGTSYRCHNNFMPSNYFNGGTCVEEFYMWYDEVIFSKSTIPAPAVVAA